MPTFRITLPMIPLLDSLTAVISSALTSYLYLLKRMRQEPRWQLIDIQTQHPSIMYFPFRPSRTPPALASSNVNTS